LITREFIHQLPPDTCYGLLRDHVLPAVALAYAIGAARKPLFRVADLTFTVLSGDRRAKLLVTQPMYRARIGLDRKLGGRTLVYAEFIDRSTTKVVFEAEKVKSFGEVALLPEWAKWYGRALATSIGYGGYIGTEHVLNGDLLARDDLADAMGQAFLDRLYAAADALLTAEIVERYGC
jgi:hypothetical protein